MVHWNTDGYKKCKQKHATSNEILIFTDDDNCDLLKTFVFEVFLHMFTTVFPPK